MVVVKGFLIVLGILLLIAEEPILGIILIVVGLAVKSKKKEQPQSAARYSKPQLSRSQIEDRKRYLLNEMQMSQQRLNQCNMEFQIENKTGGFDGLLGVANMGVRLKEQEKEQEYLNKLKKEYNDLSKL